MNVARRIGTLGQGLIRRSYHDHIEGLRANMDMLAKPNGAWAEHNAKRQSFFNLIFVGGLVYLVASAGFVIGNGFIDLVPAPPMKNKK